MSTPVHQAILQWLRMLTFRILYPQPRQCFERFGYANGLPGIVLLVLGGERGI